MATKVKKSELKAAIRHYVFSGFYDASEVVKILMGSIFEGLDLDRTTLRAEVKKAFTTKKIAEKKWPEQTDCDRLDAVFAALHRQRILAVQNAGYTLSDGLADVAELYFAAHGQDSGYIGYCFYHGQDLERVVDSGELSLAFGGITGDGERGVEIGKVIKTAFESAGFKVKWNSTMKQRLLVKGIKWQRRKLKKIRRPSRRPERMTTPG
jgi:hypothetical protein